MARASGNSFNSQQVGTVMISRFQRLSIAYSSFAGSNITNITIPKNVTSFGTDAFHGCKNLTSFTYLGSTEPKYDDTVFNGCDSLRFICIPKNYSGTSFCGKTGIANSDDCDSLRIEDNECYEVFPSPDHVWENLIKEETKVWENQTDNCVAYLCNNETGYYAKGNCSGSLCLNDSINKCGMKSKGILL